MEDKDFKTAEGENNTFLTGEIPKAKLLVPEVAKPTLKSEGFSEDGENNTFLGDF